MEYNFQTRLMYNGECVEIGNYRWVLDDMEAFILGVYRHTVIPFRDVGELRDLYEDIRNKVLCGYLTEIIKENRTFPDLYDVIVDF